MTGYHGVTDLFLTATCAHDVLSVERVLVLVDRLEHEGRRLALVYRPVLPVLLEEDTTFCAQQRLVFASMMPVLGGCRLQKKWRWLG